MRPVKLILDDLVSLSPEAVFAEDEALPTIRAKIVELQNEIATAIAEVDTIMAAADAADRDFSEEEKTRIRELHAAVDNAETQKKLREGQVERMERNAAALPRQSEAPPANGVDNRSAALPREAERNLAGALASRQPLQSREVERGSPEMWGWDSRAEFMKAVYAARGGKVHDLLVRKAAVNTEIGEHGAYAVPPAIANEIMTKVFSEAGIASKCDIVNTSGDRYQSVQDEDEPWSSNGIKVGWIGAGKKLTESQPNFTNLELKLNKMYALVPFTNEALQDTAQLDQFVRTKVPQKMAEELDNVVLNGTGANQPQGLLNSTALLVVAKETTGFGTNGTDAQPAGSLVYKNFRKIWTRVYAPCRRPGTMWIGNPDVEEVLFDMEFPGDKRPIYLAGNSLAGQPNSTLMARDIHWSQHATALGKPGDLTYVDLQQYLLVRKIGANPRVDTSMHVLFDYDMTSFRFIMRVAGQPKWSRTIDQKNSSVDRSCFVTLAERA